MIYTKEQFISTVKMWLKDHPNDAPDTLAAVAEALHDFKERQEKAREQQTRNAISMLFRPGIIRGNTFPKGNKAPFLLDAAHLLFPDAVNGHSTHNQDAFDLFVEACRAEEIDPDWVELTRGRQVAAWYRRVIQPLVEAKPDAA